MFTHDRVMPSLNEWPMDVCICAFVNLFSSQSDIHRFNDGAGVGAGEHNIAYVFGACTSYVCTVHVWARGSRLPILFSFTRVDCSYRARYVCILLSINYDKRQNIIILSLLTRLLLPVACIKLSWLRTHDAYGISIAEFIILNQQISHSLHIYTVSVVLGV